MQEKKFKVSRNKELKPSEPCVKQKFYKNARSPRLYLLLTYLLELESKKVYIKFNRYA